MIKKHRKNIYYISRGTENKNKTLTMEGVLSKL